jgi:hypothetical protein
MTWYQARERWCRGHGGVLRPRRGLHTASPSAPPLQPQAPPASRPHPRLSSRRIVPPSPPTDRPPAQPPGYVHVMLAATPADQALYVTWAQGSPGGKRAVHVPVLRRDPVTREAVTVVERQLRASGVSLSAQATADGSRVYVRAVNSGATAQNVSVTLTNLPAGSAIGAAVSTLTLAAASQAASNSPQAPTAVVPVAGTAEYPTPGGGTGGGGGTYTLPPNSFTVLGFSVVKGALSGGGGAAAAAAAAA